MDLSGKDEIYIELFQLLDEEQKRDVLKRIRALVDANKVTMKINGDRKLNIATDERVEETLGFPKPKKKAPKRDPGPGMDDFLGGDS